MVRIGKTNDSDPCGYHFPQIQKGKLIIVELSH